MLDITILCCRVRNLHQRDLLSLHRCLLMKVKVVALQLLIRKVYIVTLLIQIMI